MLVVWLPNERHRRCHAFAGVAVDFDSLALQPASMRTGVLTLGALAWISACGDDGTTASVTNADAGSDTEESTTTPTHTPSSLDADASGSGISSSLPATVEGPSSDGGTLTSGSAPISQSTPRTDASDATSHVSDVSCENECELEAVRCSGDDILTVEQCRVNATGCTEWHAVEDCENGSCLSGLFEESCDTEADAPRCSDAGVMVCDRGPEGCPVWQSPSEQMLTRGDVDIDESATVFTGYGVLQLKLTSEVSANDLVACLSDPRPLADRADAPGVVQVLGDTNGEYELQLSRYQLPVAYELTVAWGSPPVARTTVLAPDDKSRVAFISTTTGNGDLASWTQANDAPLAAADAICQADAEAAGLSGTFRAFLSIGGETDALCRLRGGQGLLDEGCGLVDELNEQALAAPFLDLKGLPIAYGTQDIEQGLWRLPVGFDAGGVQGRLNGITAWTGSQTDGLSSGYDCNGWSSAASDSFGDAAASPGVQIVNDLFSFGCDDTGALLCFSGQADVWPLTHAHQRTGKLAYVVETLPDPTMGEADAACEQSKPEGTAEVVAWFGDDEADAVCRLLGQSGSMDDGCGGDAIDWSSGPWVRADGYVVAETLEDFTGALLAPLHLGPDGTFDPPQGPEIVRTDTYAGGAASDIASQCIVGDRMASSTAWTYSGRVACSNIESTRTFVYCLER